MLPIERALKRLEKNKKYKPKDINYDIEYLVILRRRLNFLYIPEEDIVKASGFNNDERKDMEREFNTVKFLIECLEKRIWNNKKEEE